MSTSVTQELSHRTVQQKGSFTQTWTEQRLHPMSSATPEAHSLWAQLPPQERPQTLVTSSTQAASQVLPQQKGSEAQIWVTQGSHPTVSATPLTHLSWAQCTGQAPQSLGQPWQSSPAWQLPSPQTGGQAPQSLGQLWQVSAGPSHIPLPQTGPQMPQSCGQFAQVSAPAQAPFPQSGGHTPQSPGQLAQLSPG